MLLAAIGFAIFFAIGWARAARREGTRADKVQMGLSHGIPAAILGFAISIVIVSFGL